MPKLAASTVLFLALAACTPGEGNEFAAGDGSDAVASPAGNSAATSPPPDTPVSSEDPVAPQPPATPTPECPVVASRGWSAAVIGKPPGSGDRLRVSGTLTLSGDGYRARLEQGPVLEIHPPIQQLELRFERSGGRGPREVAVRGEFPALSEYGSIDIRCGNRTVATISSVAWTENRIMDEKQ